MSLEHFPVVDIFASRWSHLLLWSDQPGSYEDSSISHTLETSIVSRTGVNIGFRVEVNPFYHIKGLFSQTQKKSQLMAFYIESLTGGTMDTMVVNEQVK